MKTMLTNIIPLTLSLIVACGHASHDDQRSDPDHAQMDHVQDPAHPHHENGTTDPHAHHETVAAVEPDMGASIYGLEHHFVDQDGTSVELDIYRGHPVIIGMVYASCTSICPVIVANIKRIESSLPADVLADTRVVLVSLDPDRDTPAALRDLAVRHEVDLARWRFLSTTESAVRDVAAVLGVRYRRLPDGEINHSPMVALLGRNGLIVERLEELWAPTADFEARLRNLPRLPLSPK